MKTIAEYKDEIYEMLCLDASERKSYDKNFLSALNAAAVEVSSQIVPIYETAYMLIAGEDKPTLSLPSLRAERFDSAVFVVGNVGKIDISYSGSGRVLIHYHGRSDCYVLRGNQKTLTAEIADGAEYISIYSDEELSFSLTAHYSPRDEEKPFVRAAMHRITEGRFVRFSRDLPVTETGKEKMERSYSVLHGDTVLIGKKHTGIYSCSFQSETVFSIRLQTLSTPSPVWEEKG